MQAVRECLGVIAAAAGIVVGIAVAASLLLGVWGLRPVPVLFAVGIPVLVALPFLYRDRQAYETAVLFPGPAEAVFDWVETPANWTRFPEVVSAGGSGKPREPVTMVWRVPHRDHVDEVPMSWEVVAYERPRRTSAVCKEGAVTIVSENRYDEQPGGGGTVLATVVRMAYDRPAGPFVRRRHRIELAKTHDRLERMAELFAQASPSA